MSTGSSDEYRHLKMDQPRRNPSPPKIRPEGPYSGICIGGGAAGGYQFLGTLHYFYTETEWMKNVRVFAGTSVGACMSGMLAIGYTPQEILHYLCKHDVDHIFNIDVSRIHTHWGVVDTQRWIDYIREAIVLKLGYVPTLRELFEKTGHIVCFATWCLTKKPCDVYLTPDTYPDLPLDVAIAMSSCIPCLFMKCEYDGNLYLDGGIFDSCPSVKAESLLNRDERLLVVRFDSYDVPSCITSWSDYLKNILKACDLVQRRRAPKRGDEIVIKSDFSSVTLQVEITKRIQLFKTAYKRIKYQLFLPKLKVE